VLLIGRCNRPPFRAVELKREGCVQKESGSMSEKFDSAPADKHADKSSGRDTCGKQARDELERGLKESFPASDPVSSSQPKKTTKDND
jgi:hypothetical protein